MQQEVNYEDEEHKATVAEILADPRNSLPTYAHVQDMASDRPVLYDPGKITGNLQSTLLHYVADPPRTADGKSRWLVTNKYRQGGSSTTTALAFYAKTQYTEGWEHITAADNEERARYLFERVNFCHDRWPADIAEPVRNTIETRSLTWQNSSKMRVLGGRTTGAGIGRSPSSLHMSELPLWKDAAGQFSYLLPAMVNRENSQIVMESTPFPLHEPSAPWFKELCETARANEGRWAYLFQPFWDGLLNQRPWLQGDVLTIEEQRLMDAYHHLGLRHRHLKFRREMLNTDPNLKRHPELFRIFYPFDDLTCWQSESGNVIKPRHLERHLSNLVDWDGDTGYAEYDSPRADASYCIGVDPSGYGARDHASFHVFEVWQGSWRQVAVYATHADPPAVAKTLFSVGRKFNNALIVPERNSVGVAICALMETFGYPNMYYDRDGRPGMHKNDESEYLARLIDALMNTLVIHDRDTITQLQGYRSDRAVQVSLKSELLGLGEKKNRRSRHHWDKVSALMLMVMGARTMDLREDPRSVKAFERRHMPFSKLTLDEIEKMEERMGGRDVKRGNRRSKYTSVRKGRRR